LVRAPDVGYLVILTSDVLKPRPFCCTNLGAALASAASHLERISCGNHAVQAVFFGCGAVGRTPLLSFYAMQTEPSTFHSMPFAAICTVCSRGQSSSIVTPLSDSYSVIVSGVAVDSEGHVHFIFVVLIGS